MALNRGDKARLLVTADEFHGSLALIRGLVAAEYRLLVAVSRRDTLAARARGVEQLIHVPSEERQPEEFAAAVSAAAAECQAACVLAGSEAALLALARHRERLTVPLAAPARERVELATDKDRVLTIAQDCGLMVPRARGGTAQELRAQAEQVEYPAVLKATRSRLQLPGDRLVRTQAQKVHNPEELRQALATLPGAEWILQPWLPGELLAVGGAAHEGELIATVHQRAIRTWPPEMGFSCFAQAVPRDCELEQGVRRLIARLEWSGLFQLQLMRDAQGIPHAIDFNPRAYGSLALALAAGVNLSALWAASVLGDDPPPAHYRPGVSYRLLPAELRSCLWLIRRGDIGAALRMARPRRATTHAIVTLRDPGPGLELAARVARRLRA